MTLARIPRNVPRSQRKPNMRKNPQHHGDTAPSAALEAGVVEKMVALLPDLEAALVDLHACPDADCAEPNCLRALPRLRALLDQIKGGDT